MTIADEPKKDFLAALWSHLLSIREIFCIKIKGLITWFDITILSVQAQSGEEKYILQKRDC